MMNQLSKACKAFSLTISIRKTVVLTQEGTDPCNITLDGTSLENVNKFCYLGSTITTSSSMDEEITARIGKAATTFGKLTKRHGQQDVHNEKLDSYLLSMYIQHSSLYLGYLDIVFSPKERKTEHLPPEMSPQNTKC